MSHLEPGSVTTFERDDSALYPGTHRRFHVHVPAAYDGSEPASLAVFLDGSGYLDPDDDLRAGAVLDDLVASGDLPVTIGVFVDPGETPEPETTRPRQRNREYDAADDSFATHLLEEVLPVVAARWNVTTDPARRAVVGFSSGGNGAFTVAWQRPDAFRGVVCASASWAQVPGRPYPEVLVDADHERLRVFLSVGQRDLGWDEPEDNWVVDNLRVAAALVEAGHETWLALGNGGHDSAHAGQVLPDALRWVLGVRGAAG